MATEKLFPMSSDHMEFIQEVMKTDAPGLASYGLNFKFIGTMKQPKVIDVSTGSKLLEYIAKEEQVIAITLFEEAFERLTDEYKKLIVAHALDSISFDTEKDKVSVKGKGSLISEGVYLKYREPSVLAVFAGDAAVRQIDEEKKEAKRIAAEEKAQNKKNNF